MWDAKKAADYARNNANTKSVGECAKYVANALIKAGFSFTRQSSAYMYHTNGILLKIGFSQIFNNIFIGSNFFNFFINIISNCSSC